ncbi:MAG: putative membrane protein SpoIIM required for sporulation [Flavobacteriales bacterium]|jgi:uncharacterized membrane protein SpoIIM required for sporulation
MRETDFIDQNKEKWHKFESLLAQEKSDPGKLSQVFVEITDDLSFSRTHYSNRSVRVYLNGFAQQIYQLIYKSRKSDSKGFSHFWTHSIPKAMWHSRIALLISFSLFAGAFILGFLSGMYHPDYAEIMMGADYITMTEENIAKEDPMAVYKQDPIDMFLMIAENNIRVCFRDFITGILAGVGTVFSLLLEGTRIGAFFQFFHKNGLLDQAFFTVMLHGTLELSLLVLSGCAGLTLASGLLFPGVLTRFQALILSARRSMTIMIAVAILLLLAAFIESFATRLTDLPYILRGGIIFLSFSFILFYFVIYPWILHRKGILGEQDKEELRAPINKVLRWNEIKSSTQIFTEVFVLFGRNIKLIAKMAFLLSSFLTIGITLLLGEGLVEFLGIYEWDQYVFPVGMIWIWDDVNNFFEFRSHIALFPLYMAGLSSFLIGLSWVTLQSTDHEEKLTLFLKRHIVSSLITSVLLLAPLLLGNGWSIIFSVALWPILLLAYASSLHQKQSIFKSLASVSKLLRNRFWALYSCTIVLLAIPWMGMFLVSSSLWDYVHSFIELNISAELSWAYLVPVIIYCSAALFCMIFLFSQFVIGSHLFYASAKEVQTAESLKERISHIALRKQAYGLDREAQ